MKRNGKKNQEQVEGRRDGWEKILIDLKGTGKVRAGGGAWYNRNVIKKGCHTCLLSPNMLHTISREYGCSNT